MILWHNTKLKTIGAIMSTLCIQGCCRCCSAAVFAVLSVACLVFISPTFLSIYTFTDSPTAGWLCAPRSDCGQNAAAKTNNYPSADSVLQLSAIHILDRFHKTRPGWKCYILRHIPDSEPDRIIMSHTTQNLQLMPQFPSASLALALMAAFFRGDFSHALKNRHFKTSTPLL